MPQTDVVRNKSLSWFHSQQPRNSTVASGGFKDRSDSRNMPLQSRIINANPVTPARSVYALVFDIGMTLVSSPDICCLKATGRRHRPASADRPLFERHRSPGAVAQNGQLAAGRCSSWRSLFLSARSRKKARRQSDLMVLLFNPRANDGAAIFRAECSGARGPQPSYWKRRNRRHEL